MSKQTIDMNGPVYTRYLNQSGHRWIMVDPAGRRGGVRVRLSKDTPIVRRSVYYWEAIGNFAVPTIRLKGKPVMLMEGAGEGYWIPNNAENRAERF